MKYNFYLFLMLYCASSYLVGALEQTIESVDSSSTEKRKSWIEPWLDHQVNEEDAVQSESSVRPGSGLSKISPLPFQKLDRTPPRMQTSSDGQLEIKKTKKKQHKSSRIGLSDQEDRALEGEYHLSSALVPMQREYKYMHPDKISFALDKEYDMFALLQGLSQSFKQEKNIRSHDDDSVQRLKKQTHSMFYGDIPQRNQVDSAVLELEIKKEEAHVQELASMSIAEAAQELKDTFTDKEFQDAASVIADFAVAMADADIYTKDPAESDQEYIIRMFVMFIGNAVEFGIFTAVPVVGGALLDAGKTVVRIGRAHGCCAIF